MSLKSTHSRSKCGEEKFFDMLEWGIVRSPECDGQYRNISPPNGCIAGSIPVRGPMT